MVSGVKLRRLKRWKLKGKAKSITKSRNVKQISAAYRDFVQYFSATSASVAPVLIQSPEKPSPQKGDAEADPVSRLLTALQSAKIDQSGPPNGITKKNIGGIVKVGGCFWEFGWICGTLAFGFLEFLLILLLIC